MAQTIPVYINVDTITSASISDGSETTAASITTNSGAVADGLLWGVHGKLSSTAGAVIVRVNSCCPRSFRHLRLWSTAAIRGGRQGEWARSAPVFG